MNTDVEFHIRQNYPWNKLPGNVKQALGNSAKEYEKAVFNFSVKNQLRYKGNLVRHVRKDEKRYYEDLLRYSRDHLMLYPYHLSDVMVKGLRTTPFSYYIGIMCDIMTQEKSYDSLPNFTAADCLRLLGIGRNQYIELMNQCRSSKKFFRKKPIRDLLPIQPVDNVLMEPWWIIQAGYITEEDIRICLEGEKKSIDSIIDSGPCPAAKMELDVLHGLYRKGLVYLDVPISDDDCIIVPPLEGFVMNRVLGDYFETLLYKIFVSIDEHTSVSELANVLQIDLQLVKNAVSVYCRLGFAKKKGVEQNVEDLPSSWQHALGQNLGINKKPTPDQLLISSVDWTTTLEPVEQAKPTNSPDNCSLEGAETGLLNSNAGHSKRIAFLFDSTLTAFLMMGNLSPGLKSHAVTMFEVGKLSDESLDSFLSELEKVESVAEGEAQRYFDHAITLRDTVRFLRHNKDLSIDPEVNGQGQGIDLLRCESLLGLDPATCSRVLNKNYSLLVSMAPLSNEIRPVSSCTPQHMGPCIPEVNSVWFKLYIYQLTGCGPPSLLLVKGTRLRRLPKVFQDYDRLLITTWGHDPAVICTSNILLMLNDALSHSAVMVQGHGWRQKEGATQFVPFPLTKVDKPECSVPSFEQHPAIEKLATTLDLKHSCGYVTLLKSGKFTPAHTVNNQPSDPNTISPSAAKSSKDSANSAVTSGAGARSHSCSPRNGIKDPTCAKVLASELDSLDTDLDPDFHKSIDIEMDKTVTDRTQLRLPLELEEGSTVPRAGAKGDKARPDDLTFGSREDLESNWLILDCCFGIPLFDAKVNQQVCDRIASQGLCNKESLQELLHSSRKLTLQLLNFITEHQDLPVFQEHAHESCMFPQYDKMADQLVPLPTHSLLFDGASLRTWTGR